MTRILTWRINSKRIDMDGIKVSRSCVGQKLRNGVFCSRFLNVDFDRSQGKFGLALKKDFKTCCDRCFLRTEC